jgi:hypothetical protein
MLVCARGRIAVFREAGLDYARPFGDATTVAVERV